MKATVYSSALEETPEALYWSDRFRREDDDRRRNLGPRAGAIEDLQRHITRMLFFGEREA